MAILIAIAIPAFTSQLENARKAVDEGNMRSAMSEAVSDYLLTAKTGKVTYQVMYDDTTKSLSVSDSGSANLTPKSKAYGAPSGAALTIEVEEGVATPSWTETP